MVVKPNGEHKENERFRDRYLDEKFGRLDDKLDTMVEGMKTARDDRVKLFESQKTMSNDIAALKVKSGIWGGISGMASATIILVGAWAKGHLGK